MKFLPNLSSNTKLIILWTDQSWCIIRLYKWTSTCLWTVQYLIMWDAKQAETIHPNTGKDSVLSKVMVAVNSDNKNARNEVVRKNGFHRQKSNKVPVPSLLAWSVQQAFCRSALHNWFSMFGIPRDIKTDNGPPFSCTEFCAFSEIFGFKHHRVTFLARL